MRRATKDCYNHHCKLINKGGFCLAFNSPDHQWKDDICCGLMETQTELITLKDAMLDYHKRHGGDNQLPMALEEIMDCVQHQKQGR